MTEQMSELFGSAAFLIGLLVVSAIQNRRKGWKKQRQVYTASESFSPLWEYFENSASQPVARVAMPLETVTDVAGFSLQLTKIAAGLRGNSTPVKIEMGQAAAVEVRRSK